MSAAPATESAAVAQLAEDLRRDHHLVAAAVVEAGYRELAGPIVAELLAISPRDRLSREMVRAWGEGNAAAVLAAYASLHAPATDSDVEAALAAIASTPAALDAPDLYALAGYELAYQCRRVGLLEAARLADAARTAEAWADLEDALASASVAPADGIRRDGIRIAAHNLARNDRHMAVATLAALAHVSPTTWLSSTRTMIEMEADEAGDAAAARAFTERRLAAVESTKGAAS